MWLQGPWSGTWPKMDAFLNVTQVYLYLSPPLSLSASFAFEDDVPVGFISCSVLHQWCLPLVPCWGWIIPSPMPLWSSVYTARCQAGISGSFWLLAEWWSPCNLWSDGAEDGFTSAWYLEIPQLFPILCWEGASLFLFVCFLERLPVGFSDEFVSEMLPFRLNPVDNWAVMDQSFTHLLFSVLISSI